MIIDYKGSKVFYNDVGKGPTLVFIHGFLESSKIWDYLIEELEDGYRCISIDLFGHGKSDDIDEVYSMELYADLIKIILDKLKIKKCTLFGHSMGGYASLAVADLFPDLTNGLCLINSTALADDEERKANRDRAIDLVRADKRTFISVSISNLFDPKNLLIYNDEINELKKNAYQVSLKSIINALKGMRNRSDRSKIFENFKYKKLVVLGASDSILPLDKQLHYLKNRNIQTKVVQGGHMLYIENKYEITYIIKQFIE